MNILSKYLENQRLKIVGEYIKGDVLDLGCGTAKLYSIYSGEIHQYIGVDSDKKNIESNKRKYPNATFYIKNLDEEDWKLKKQFDLILMIALVEHIFNQKKLFTEAKKYLKPNGSIVITTPTPFGNDFIYSIGCKIGLFAKNANDDHIVIYNKKRFTVLTGEVGLELVSFKKFEFGLNQLVVLKR